MLNKILNYSIVRSVLSRSGVREISTAYAQILRKMSTEPSSPLDAVPRVDMDSSGVFKYILCKVYENSNDADTGIDIVRGYAKCNYHMDIYELVQLALHPLEVDPVGGGRISVNPENKEIQIYGYSQGYGRADHELTAKIIKKEYPDYKISVSNEGY